MARSPEQFKNVPLPTYDVEEDDLIDTEAAAKLAEKGHPGLSDGNIFTVDVANLEATDSALAQTAALIKEAKAMRAIVARVPLYRDAFGYDSGAQLKDEQRIPLRAAFQIMLRGGSLAQKLKLAQKRLVQGQYDLDLNEEIAREIAHIKKYEAIVTAALREQQITLPEAPTPAVVSATTRRTLKVTVPEASTPKPEAVISEIPVKPEAPVGDKPESLGGEARTIKATAMSAESPTTTKVESASAMSAAEIIRERSKAWAERVQGYTAKLDSLKQRGTAAYVESLPAYQAFLKNLQVIEPLLDGSWTEDDAVKSHLLQENMQRLAANFFTIEHSINERRAAFEASVGAETAAMRDLMDDADDEPRQSSTSAKKTGWFNADYRDARTNVTVEESPKTEETAEAEALEPLVLTPETRVDTPTESIAAASAEGVAEAPAPEGVEREARAESLAVEIGAVADIPRSDGSVSRATLTAISPDGKLLFSWHEQGQKMSKLVEPDAVNFIDTEVAVGEQVTFPRSDGSRSVGTVKEVLPSGLVNVVWNEGENFLTRNVYLGDLLPTADAVAPMDSGVRISVAEPTAPTSDEAAPVGTDTNPDAILRAKESSLTLGQEGQSPVALKFEQLTNKVFALEEQLTKAIAETGYYDSSQPPNEIVEKLVAQRSKLKGLNARLRTLLALPAEELSVDEVHALETEVGEVEYTVKPHLKKETIEPTVTLLGMPIPTAASGPFAVRAFRDALNIEWQPVKRAAEQSGEPELVRKQAAFSEIFKLLAYVPNTGLDAVTAERIQALAKGIEQPDRIVGDMPTRAPVTETTEAVAAIPLDNAPGTAVLPMTGDEIPRGFTAGAVETGMSPRGNTPEVVISAFDKERHESLRNMQALREKEDTPQGRKWFARFGAAALLTLLATPIDDGKNTQAGSPFPPGVSMIDGKWSTSVPPTTETAGDIILPDFTTDTIPTTITPDKPTAAEPEGGGFNVSPETVAADVEPEVTVMPDTDTVVSPGVDAIPVVESVSTHLYTFDGARGLNGKVIDTVSEAAFDEWQRNRSLLSKPITATQFLASMWNLLSELEKNPELEKKLTTEMQIDSEDINKVFTGTQNAIDLQPFYKLLESRI